MNALDMMIIWILCLFSVSLKTLCVWNLAVKLETDFCWGCHPGHLSFILRTASDILPTPVNLQRWHIQCDVKCSLWGTTRPTTAHVLGGLPCCFIIRSFYLQAWSSFALHSFQSLSGLLAESQAIHIYADLPGMYASVSPQATIPPSLIITPYHPDIVVHNKSTKLMQLCCYSWRVIWESARDRKQIKEQYGLSRALLRGFVDLVLFQKSALCPEVVHHQNDLFRHLSALREQSLSAQLQSTISNCPPPLR